MTPANRPLFALCLSSLAERLPNFYQNRMGKPRWATGRKMMEEQGLWLSLRRKPFPVLVLVAALSEVGIAFKRLPGSVTRNGGRMWNVQAELEQARYAILPQVMDPQVFARVKAALIDSPLNGKISELVRGIDRVRIKTIRRPVWKDEQT